MASITMAACLGLVLACLLAITLQIFLFSPISPYSLEFPPSTTADFPPPNTHLQNVIKLGEGFLKKPESVCFDKAGTLYTATRDGWIKRLHRNGTWEDWKMLDGRDSLLGLTVTEAGDVIVCDADKGLLKVSEDRVSVLASHVNGAKLGMYGNEQRLLILFLSLAIDVRPNKTGRWNGAVFVSYRNINGGRKLEGCYWISLLSWSNFAPCEGCYGEDEGWSLLKPKGTRKSEEDGYAINERKMKHRMVDREKAKGENN